MQLSPVRFVARIGRLGCAGNWPETICLVLACVHTADCILIAGSIKAKASLPLTAVSTHAHRSL
ncbi:hypothetical protein BaRGS_00011058, partial [Batillaria attramentaria]